MNVLKKKGARDEEFRSCLSLCLTITYHAQIWQITCALHFLMC